jgi:hypothetical protein
VQPLLKWEINLYCIFWMCACSVRYPECNEYAPYCQMLPTRLYNIFPQCLIFEKSYLVWNVHFDFCYNFCLKLYIIRRTGRDMIKMYIFLHVKYPCQIVIKLEFYPQIFEKCSNMKFHETRSVGIELFHTNRRTERRTDGQTDRNDKVNSHFSKFCEGA